MEDCIMNCKKTNLKKAFLLSMVLPFCIIPAECSKSPTEKGGAASRTADSPDSYGRVIIENGDRTLVFTKMPERVISCNMASTENMLLLGLKNKIVGRNERTNPAEIPLPEIETAFYEIPEIERTHEQAVALEVDLMIGQVSSFRDVTWGAPELFESKGINCYIISGTIAEDETIENVYDDIEALGKIFKVEDRVAELINQAKTVVASVEAKTASLGAGERLRVFVLDTFKGNEIYTTSKGLESNLIELAGGINVTRNLSTVRWFNTSIETMVDANPDVIIFNDYGTQTLEEKLAFVRNNPAVQDVVAVKNERYIIVPLVQVMQDIRAASTCEFFARSLYPALFE
jgi:iron complex transport system substrate-binding protein